jgi:hypothetical protein
VVAPATTQLTTAVQQSTTSLNPLLLVAGVSIAVVVFCLLLMTSRPLAPVSSHTEEPSGSETRPDGGFHGP